MTPQEIFEYKNRWMNNDPWCIPFHSDLQSRAISWCKENLQSYEYKLIEYTDVYEHTLCFEKKEHANRFEEYIA